MTTVHLQHPNAHGDRPGGSLHALVIAAGAAGFMSGGDKTKLDMLDTNYLRLDATNDPLTGELTTQAIRPDTNETRDLGTPTFAFSRVRGKMARFATRSGTSVITEPANSQHGGIIAGTQNGVGLNTHIRWREGRHKPRRPDCAWGARTNSITQGLNERGTIVSHGLNPAALLPLQFVDMNFDSFANDIVKLSIAGSAFSFSTIESPSSLSVTGAVSSTSHAGPMQFDSELDVTK